MNAFFKSQFNYCPLLWCFRKLRNKINCWITWEKLKTEHPLNYATLLVVRLRGSSQTTEVTTLVVPFTLLDVSTELKTLLYTKHIRNKMQETILGDIDFSNFIFKTWFILYIDILVDWFYFDFSNFIFSPRHWNTGLVSSRVSLTSWGEGASLALVGHPSSHGVTIKMPFGVDVLHGPASFPIFSYWIG